MDADKPPKQVNYSYERIRGFAILERLRKSRIAHSIDWFTTYHILI
jgi:hypothetical protein